MPETKSSIWYSELALSDFYVTLFGWNMIGKGFILVLVNAYSALDKELWKQN